MAENNKIYWKGVEQLTNDPGFVKSSEKEFSGFLPIKDAYGDNSAGLETNRRDFLKLMGFGVAAVGLAACETPVRKAIPYLNKPESVDPGVPNFYASTYINGSDYCAVLVKTREGRPVKIEGNSYSNVTFGATDARTQASVLSLYDQEKQKSPSKGGQAATWEAIDKEIADKLSGLDSIALVTGTILSPSTKKAIAGFISKYPGTKHITYDAYSSSALRKAYNGVLPTFRFDKAKVVAGFGADFLGTWISPLEYSNGYSQGRRVGKDKKAMSRHYHVESIMTLTGANADYRVVIKPSQEGLAVAQLYNAVASAKGGEQVSVSVLKEPLIDACAKDLLAAEGESLVVSGSNDWAIQTLVAAINKMLGNEGKTVDLSVPSFQQQGDDAAMAGFVAGIGSTYKGAIFYNANPVYDHPMGAKIAEGIKKLQLSVATSDRLDETASVCQYNCPDSHYLESWNDAEPKKGYFSLGQPAIGRIFDTRQVQDSLLIWSGSDTDYLSFLKDNWKESMFRLQSKESNFKDFWQRSLHNGVFEISVSGYKSIHEGGFVAPNVVVAKVETTEKPAAEIKTAEVKSEDSKTVAAGTESTATPAPAPASSSSMSSVAEAISKNYKAENKGFELVIYPSVSMGTGQLANNPLLQETPDPISKVCWGNYISVSQAFAVENNYSLEGFNTMLEGRAKVMKVTVNGVAIEMPIVVQPGQQKDTLAIALGYGRNEANAGKVAAEAGGVNAAPMAQMLGENINYIITTGVSLEDTGNTAQISQTQTSQTILGRTTIIKETVLDNFKSVDYANPGVLAWRYDPFVSKHGKRVKPGDVSLWDVSTDGYKGEGDSHGATKKEEVKENPKDLLWTDRVGLKADTHTYANHHWGMAIDLNTCTGCSACIVACNVENNVPVVGKVEVAKRREMHWLRIDRYYSSKGTASNDDLIKAAENPEVVFQPMMCQHCNNAPCETVCPVAATTHSSEGLNQMTYNRCVGTKYCANNCPYKVRRFNWFKYHDNNEFNYHTNNDLGKMVLNPDVTVRSRGVMEKCSMCVQKIQSGKLKAKSEGRRVVDGDINTACASACPTNAITFGDLNDKESKIRTWLEDELTVRAYNVLEEIAVSPNVWYMAKIRNKSEDKQGA